MLFKGNNSSQQLQANYYSLNIGNSWNIYALWESKNIKPQLKKVKKHPILKKIFLFCIHGIYADKY